MTLLHQAAQKAVEAAQAVVARWETPLWKDAPPTAKVIYKMRDAMNELESALQQPEPGELALVIEQDPESGWWRVAGTPESGIYIAHPSVDACIADILPTWRLLAETAPQQVPPVPALQHQEVPSTAVIPPAPPECETEDEKTAFAFGYWQGLHAARKGQEAPREPVALERWGRAKRNGSVLLERMAGGYWTPWHIAQEALAASPSTTQQQEAGGDALDGRRYRWLRQYGLGIYWDVFSDDEAMSLGTVEANAARLDSAIDKVLAAAPSTPESAEKDDAGGGVTGGEGQR